MSAVVIAAENGFAAAEVVALAQGGDAAARERLATDCQGVAYRVALQLTGNRDDALDVAQDALLRVFGALGRFRTGEPLQPWLYRIVHNLVRDRRRRRRVRRTEAMTPFDGALVLEPADPAPDPEARSSRLELQRLVWTSLAELDESQRTIIVLRDYEGLAYDEIAAVLRIPRGTVMSRLHRARQRLADSVRRRLDRGQGRSDG